jgi:hypothetical protein
MPAQKAGAIRVEGLRELNKSLRAIGPEARAELKAASSRVSGFVASDAHSAAAALGGVAAKTAPSLKPRASVSGSAGVALGGSAYPFGGGAEFGSDRYKQFKPWRGNGPGAGYFLYPSIRKDAQRITTEYTQALEDLIKKVGLS